MSLPLPESVDRFLREYVRQRNLLLFWRGASLLLVVAVAWVIGWCLADRVAHFDAWWRWVLVVTTAGGFGVWLAVLLRGTLLAKIDLDDAALEVELIRPDLDQRLATICSRLRDEREGLASREMLDAIAQQVQTYISERGLPRIVSFRSVGNHAICAAILILTVAALSLVPLLGLPRLLARFAVPWGKIPPVSTTQIMAQVAPDGVDLKEKEAFILNVGTIRPGEEGVILHFSTDGKTWATSPMTVIGQDRYQTVLGPVSSDQSFFLTSGDARTETSPVRLLKRPAITEFRVRYEYPAYMHREPFIARNVDGLIEAPVGTKATVEIVATEKLKSAILEAKEFKLPLAATIEQGVMEGSFSVNKDQPYAVNMVSAKGIDGTGPQGSQIRALPDRPPFVQMVSPVDDLRISPRDITSVKYQAIDDYGLTHFVIKLQVNNAPALEVPTKARNDQRRREGEEELDMANLGLKVGDVVAVTLVARDGAGQEASSETRYLFISPHSVNTADYTRMSELQRSAETAKELEKGVQSSIQSLDAARGQKQNPQRFAEASSKYEQNIADTGQQAEALRQSLTRAIARSSDPKLNDTLSAMADRAQVRMIEAHDLIDELGKGDAREQGARQRLERSLEQTRQMREQLQVLATSERAAAALADTRNLKAAEQAQQTGKMTARATEMLGRMKQDVADQTRQLGLNPDDSNVEKQLESKAQVGKDLAAKSKDVDFAEAAQAWSDQLLDEKNHPPMFDRRLSAAADVESVRPDGDLQKASDLNLSARAAQAIWLTSRDTEGKATADQARKEYVKAFGDLGQKAQAPDERQRADEARRKMAKWAGDSEAAAGPADGTPLDDEAKREVALDANEQMANRRYDRASELQKRMALEQQQALDAAQKLKDAQAADELGQAQDALQQQLLASGAEASALAQRQREVAKRIEAQMGENETPIPGATGDTRKEAMAAIQAVQERLARMPQQLQEATQSADVQFQAHELTQRLGRDAQGAPPNRKAAADRAADRAKAAEADSQKQTEQSLTPVSPDVTKVMSSSLADFMPETNRAMDVLEKKLQPSLQKVGQSAADNKAQDMLRGVKQARDAIAEAQSELRDAQQALLDRDPLFAAKVYADAAAEALSKHPPDMEAAAANQKMASQSLGKQWSLSVHDAAAAHLSSVSSFRKVYDEASPPAAKTPGQDLASARQWGTLRERQAQDMTAAAREEDPGGYQKMLQVYFRTLGKAREQEKK